MPAYKAKYLRESIESILYQTYTDFELVIVDDASPEDIGNIVSEYDDPRITYYRNEMNVGGKNLVAQWNHGIAYAKGDFIILASDDDIYDKEYLTCMDKLVRQYPGINVFRPRINNIDSEGKVIKNEHFVSASTDVLDLESFLNLFSSGAILSGVPQYTFRAESLRRIGGFVEFPMGWFSDDATVAALAKDGVAMCDEVLFSMRFSGLNISSMRNSLAQVSQKTEATAKYLDFMKELLSSSYGITEPDETFAKLCHRAKSIEAGIVDKMSFCDAVKALHGIKHMNSVYFPLRWRIHRLIDNLLGA